jgi:hypothetical protein
MATSRAKAAVKKYVTPKWISIAIAAICISIVVIMLFGGWSIRETKQRIKPLENNQEVFKKQSEAEKKIINQINSKVDSLEKVIEAKNKERAKQVTIIYKNRDEANKKIDTYNSDSIREAFRRL